MGLSGFFFYKRISGQHLFDAEFQKRHQQFIPKLPKDLTFAGEKVHFKNPGAYKLYYKELKINTSNNSSTRLLLKNVRLWMPQIEQVLKAGHIPLDFKYLAIAESGLSNVVSQRGAAGFWQFRESTAISYGLEVNNEVDERYHPLRSTRAACKYFKEAHQFFGNWTSAAASFNRGINGLDRAYKKQGTLSYYDLDLNYETSRYLFKVIALKDLISRPKKYQMHVSKPHKIHIDYLKVDTTIHDLKTFAAKRGINYQLLLDFNPWLLKNSLTIKEPGKVYYLALPQPSSLPKAQMRDSVPAPATDKKHVEKA
jgi:hypothetical protein